MKDDLFNECYDRQVSPEEFRQVFCNRCRNPRCQLAGWANDQFGSRMNTQLDRLFNTQLASPDDPRFQHVHEAEFPNLLRQAIRLNMADKRGDWSLPEENVHLAPIAGEPASEESASLVNEALKSLKPENSSGTQDAEGVETPEPIRETQTTPDMESQKSSKKVDQPPEPEVQPELKMPANFRGNTDFPEDGVMIGGAQPPVTKQAQEPDPWEPKKKENFVKPGATVKMGDKKK